MRRARYFRWGAEEQSGDQRNGVLPLVQREGVDRAAADARILGCEQRSRVGDETAAPRPSRAFIPAEQRRRSRLDPLGSIGRGSVAAGYRDGRDRGFATRGGVAEGITIVLGGVSSRA